MKTVKTKKQIKKEQQQEARYIFRTFGTLQAEEMIKFAKDKNTALHQAFEWDNTKAGHKHRLWQARQLIVTFTIEIEGENDPVQEYVSLTTDRKKKGGGYRKIVKVLKVKSQLEQLLEDALNDIEVFERKYKQFKGLAIHIKNIKKILQTKKSKRIAS